MSRDVIARARARTRIHTYMHWENYMQIRQENMCICTYVLRIYIPWYSDTLGITALRCDGLLQFFEARGFLELLDQALNGLFAPFVLALGLLPAQQPLDDRRVKAGQHRSHHLR